MCVRFYARRLFQVTAPVNIIGHDGVASINEDFPVGTVLCYDRDDNLYVYVQERAAPLNDPQCWPLPTRKGIPLYRDFWRHVGAGIGTPYGDSIRSATCVTVVECL